MLARGLVLLGTACIAAFATYTFYTNVTAPTFSIENFFAGLATLGLLLVLVGTAIRQGRS